MRLLLNVIFYNLKCFDFCLFRMLTSTLDYKGSFAFSFWWLMLSDQHRLWYILLTAVVITSVHVVVNEIYCTWYILHAWCSLRVGGYMHSARLIIKTCIHCITLLQNVCIIYFLDYFIEANRRQRRFYFSYFSFSWWCYCIREVFWCW